MNLRKMDPRCNIMFNKIATLTLLGTVSAQQFLSELTPSPFEIYTPNLDTNPVMRLEDL